MVTQGKQNPSWQFPSRFVANGGYVEASRYVSDHTTIEY